MHPQHQTAHEFGYKLHTPAGEITPALYQLDVVLRKEATGAHFDPVEMHLLVTHEGDVFEREITPRIRDKMDVRAVAGQVDLYDRFNEVVTFFTFGGDLHASPEDGRTLCTLTSPAPIIHLYGELSSASLLGVEAEAMLARRRAAWGADRATYRERLAKVDPFLLYAALLENLEARFKQFPPDVREDAQDFINYLHATLHRLRRSPGWPASIPSIEDLL
jgi:hypothetical protein